MGLLICINLLFVVTANKTGKQQKGIAYTQALPAKINILES